MDEIQGKIIRLQIYDEEGRTDWLLALSKVLWFFIWFLIPFCIFRFLYDLMGVLQAVIGIFIFLFIFKILGPGNLVMLDELLCRVSPTLRSAIRFGVVRIYDMRLRRDNDGRELTCIMRGDLVGGSPMRGDNVEFRGRIQNGAFIIHHGINLTTDSVLAARKNYSLHILIITVVLSVFFCLYLIGAFDSWIYDLFIGAIDMFTGPPSDLDGQ